MELSIIQSKIYQIRGVKVMLDFDLAEMYHVETRRLNESVKRNIKRFPDDFMFELTKNEWHNLMSQFATSSWGGTRKLPKAFTEQGVAMLSGLLNSDIAIEVNINIMRAFVSIRNFLYSNTTSSKEIDDLKTRIEDLEDYDRLHDTAIADLYSSLTALAEKVVDKPKESRKPVGYIKPKEDKKSE